MRRYYVYKQNVNWIGYYKNQLNIYQLENWKYLGYALNTQEIYDCIGENNILVNSFELEHVGNELYSPKWIKYRIAIIDDKNRFRTEEDLYRNVKKKFGQRQERKHSNHRWRHPNNHSEQRQSITPQEIKEISDEYGIHLKPIKVKRKLDGWDMEYQTKMQRSWKRYRRYQYKGIKSGNVHK